MSQFFNRNWVTPHINASNATFAALNATNHLRGNPLAQQGYANIMNGINNAIRFGRASATLPVQQRVRVGAIGALSRGDAVNSSRTSFVDFYRLPINNRFGARHISVGVASNAFRPVLTIIDANTGRGIRTFDARGTGTTVANFIAQAGRTYFATVESTAPAQGSYAIQKVTW
jgi:hypothetical protein